MSSLDKAMKNMKYDVRLTERHINQGSLTPQELEEHLKILPDCSANIDMMNIGPTTEKDLAETQH